MSDGFILKLRKFWLPGSTPEWTPAHRRFSYFMYFVAVVFGLLIPDDILITNSWTQKFTDGMAMIIPQIDNVSRVNLYSDVNRFLYSVLWAISPLLFPLAIKDQLHLIEVKDVENKRDIDWTLHFLRITFFLGMTIWAVFYFSYIERNRILESILVNQFYRAVAAPVMVAGSLWVVSYMAALALSVMRGTYPPYRNIK